MRMNKESEAKSRPVSPIYIDTQAHMHTRTRERARTHARAHTHPHTHTHTHARAHARAHAHSQQERERERERERESVTTMRCYELHRLCVFDSPVHLPRFRCWASQRTSDVTQCFCWISSGRTHLRLFREGNAHMSLMSWYVLEKEFIIMYRKEQKTYMHISVHALAHPCVVVSETGETVWLAPLFCMSPHFCSHCCESMFENVSIFRRNGISFVSQWMELLDLTSGLRRTQSGGRSVSVPVWNLTAILRSIRHIPNIVIHGNCLHVSSMFALYRCGQNSLSKSLLYTNLFGLKVMGNNLTS